MRNPALAGGLQKLRATGADARWKAAGANASAALTAARRSTVRMAPISEQMSASRRWSRSLEGQAMCRPVLQPSNSRGTDSRKFKVQQFTKLIPKAHATSRTTHATSRTSVLLRTLRTFLVALEPNGLHQLRWSSGGHCPLLPSACRASRHTICDARTMRVRHH